MSRLPGSQTGKHRRWALVALFLLAFLPRAIYPVSRPLQWYFRSSQFLAAVLRGNWAGTLQSEHPGVPVTWLSGGALWAWHGIQSLVGLRAPTPLETEGYAFADRVAVGVLPLALVIALGIVWGWHLLRHLFREKVAWTATLLWALNPFFLANSKVLHLDGTLSTLMLLSALWMLSHLDEKRRKPLIISAVLAGLAILTKVTALFLIPFAGLCLLVDGVSARHNQIGQHLLSAAARLGLWLLIVLVICFALWPSLWVQPGASLDMVFRQGILLHAGGPRDQPLFYRGALGVQDPGPRFYLDVLLYRTTFLTLPFSVIGLVSTWLQRKQDHGRQLGLAGGLLLAFGLFYFIQMSLGGWKDTRYMLPVLLVVDVFAAHGMVWAAERVAPGKLGFLAIIAGLIGLQAATVLALHPYYGTHYNRMLGGARAASEVFPLGEFGAGLDQAGQYIDAQVEERDAVVGTQFLANEMVAQHVDLPVHDIMQVGEDADYLVFGVQYTTRGASYARWGKLWEETYKFREPVFVARFGEAPYAWVHRPGAPPTIPEEVNAQLGGAIRLLGYRLADDEAAPGGSLLLTLYWTAEGPIAESYTVFTHLQGPGGHLVAQQDNPPRRGESPTAGWTPGTLVVDTYDLEIPIDARPGEYTVSAGMYDPATGERLSGRDAEGDVLTHDRVVLASLHIGPKVPRWQWALSAAWLTVVAGGLIYPSIAPARETAR